MRQSQLFKFIRCDSQKLLPEHILVIPRLIKAQERAVGLKRQRAVTSRTFDKHETLRPRMPLVAADAQCKALALALLNIIALGSGPVIIIRSPTLISEP